MSASECQDCLTALLEYACESEFSGEMQIARELFSLATGKVNDDDPFYESRMSAFQEFFTFDYRLAGGFSGETPFELFLLNAQTTLSFEAILTFEQIRGQQHSLFLIEKARREALVVHDLIAGQRFVVQKLPAYEFDGFEPGTVFEGRLIAFNALNYFTGAFVFHPKNVTPLLLRLVRNYLRDVAFCRASGDLDWNAEIQRRDVLLAEVAERKRQTEKSERKRAIDVLNVTKHLVHVSRAVTNPQLVMALGRSNEVSPFVPETPLVDVDTFLQRLAYCNLRSFRYKHIDPLKVYDLEVGRGEERARFGSMAGAPAPPTALAAPGSSAIRAS